VRLALCLYRYTPFGGLERNFLAVAEACRARGHAVSAFTRAWSGARPAGIEVRELAAPARTNVGLDRAFARSLERVLAVEPFDAVVGFNRLPGLDVFYAADPCFAARERGWLVRVGRRYRTRAGWERALLAPEGSTEVLVLAESERERYRAQHGTPPERLHLLPPAVRDEFLAAAPAGAAAARAELGLATDALVVLAVGSDFERKGLDRTLRALAALPPELARRTWFLVAGAGRPGRFERLARALGVAERTRFLGGREDVLALYRAADVLAHPAREENTGSVLLEAASQGVPVLASGACGFAGLVREAGVVLAEPLVEDELARELAALLADDARRAALGARGRELARAWRMVARTDAAVAVIERAALRRRAQAGTAAR